MAGSSSGAASGRMRRTVAFSNGHLRRALRDANVESQLSSWPSRRTAQTAGARSTSAQRVQTISARSSAGQMCPMSLRVLQLLQLHAAAVASRGCAGRSTRRDLTRADSFIHAQRSRWTPPDVISLSGPGMRRTRHPRRVRRACRLRPAALVRCQEASPRRQWPPLGLRRRWVRRLGLAAQLRRLDQELRRIRRPCRICRALLEAGRSHPVRLCRRCRLRMHGPLARHSRQRQCLQRQPSALAGCPRPFIRSKRRVRTRGGASSVVGRRRTIRAGAASSSGPMTWPERLTLQVPRQPPAAGCCRHLRRLRLAQHHGRA
mmetsp:Transcript_7710/g.22614  ORF Transcript_7710/g.22614 Transcript_7710/m.22614 type:complete len:318 (-) Transcript_7710:81-1034(-)